MSLLAQSSESGSRAFMELMPWLLALAVLVLLGGALMMLARRMLRSDTESTDVAFTLHDLRKLHAEGQLTDEEFEHARSAMIGHVRAASPGGGPSESDRSQPGSENAGNVRETPEESE